MSRISGIFLIRGIEMLLGVALWRTYGGAQDFWQLLMIFTAEPELGQVGTITSVILIGQRCIALVEVVWIWMSFVSKGARSLMKRTRTDTGKEASD